MAMLASKSAYPAPHGGSTYRSQASDVQSHATSFASPTESDFSESYDRQDSILDWDDKRVAEWLKSINAGQYIELFRGEATC